MALPLCALAGLGAEGCQVPEHMRPAQPPSAHKVPLNGSIPPQQQVVPAHVIPARQQRHSLVLLPLGHPHCRHPDLQLCTVAQVTQQSLCQLPCPVGLKEAAAQLEGLCQSPWPAITNGLLLLSGQPPLHDQQNVYYAALKAQARLAWYRDNHSASLTYNHQDSVAFDAVIQNALTGTPAPSNGRVRAWTITNAQYNYLFDGYLDSNINLSVGVNNLFDREPQRLPMLGGFASRLQTPWGRQFYMSVEWEPQS